MYYADPEYLILDGPIVNRHRSTSEFLEALLPHLWLRPERALVDAYQLSAVSSLFPEDLPHPSLEFGCTDGVCTFVLLGGRAKITYDDYLDVPVPSRILERDDYFEVADPLTLDVVSRPARETITYGLSWKGAHVERASRLNLYGTLIQSPLNAAIPLEENSLEFVWAPNLFQVKPEDLDSAIEGLQDVLRIGGTLVTIVPDTNQRDFELLERMPSLNSSLREVLDRGISRNLTMNAKSDKEWRAKFQQHNLEVMEHKPFLPRIVGDIYQIGFRPMFPVLLKAYKSLRSLNLSEFIRIKQQWIDTEFNFLEGLCHYGPDSEDLGTPLWHAYRLVSDD